MDKNLYLDGMMGLVIGDALGVPAEFSGREKLKVAPVEDMTGYGTYPVPAGSWSDDSSMALATLAALKDGYDLKRIMDHFVAWEQRGEFTPTGEVFDEGNTCRSAIRNYTASGDVHSCGMTGENHNGNGSLMRILPACIYLYEQQKTSQLSDDEAIRKIHEISALTHAHIRSKMACGLYYFCVKAITEQGGSLQERLQAGLNAGFQYYDNDRGHLAELGYYDRLRNLDAFLAAPESAIRSGGYVVESLEASVWCLLNTDSYRDCVLEAVNLGDDTDTTAAIAGGLAGLFYGYHAIPETWKQVILKREWIEEMCRDV